MPDRLACVYCGCTEENACLIPGDLFAPEGTRCAWMYRDPPVCSAPACLEKLRREQRSLMTIPAGTLGKQCVCGDLIYMLPHPSTKEPHPYSVRTPLGVPPAGRFAGKGVSHFSNCRSRAVFDMRRAAGTTTHPRTHQRGR